MKEALDGWLAFEEARHQAEMEENGDVDPLWVVVERDENSARLTYTSEAQQRTIILRTGMPGEFTWQMGWTHLCVREEEKSVLFPNESRSQQIIVASTASGKAQSIAGCFNDAFAALWEFEAWGSYIAPSGDELTAKAKEMRGVK